MATIFVVVSHLSWPYQAYVATLHAQLWSARAAQNWEMSRAQQHMSINSSWADEHGRAQICALLGINNSWLLSQHSSTIVVGCFWKKKSSFTTTTQCDWKTESENMFWLEKQVGGALNELFCDHSFKNLDLKIDIQKR